MRRRCLVLLAALLAATVAAPGPRAMGAQDLLVGGGVVTGVYFKVALHACNLVNRVSDGAYNCIGRPSLGSVFNINAASRGLLDFGVAQSDTNHQAVMGEGEWDGEPVENLRSVFSVHTETVLLVTRAESGIAKVADLRGRQVNLGAPGSGARVNAEQVLSLYGIDIENDLRAQGLQQNEANQALIEGKIDAFFYTVGNPAIGIEDIANAIPIRIVPIDSPDVVAFVGERPYYVMTEVPAGVYAGVDQAVPTYGTKATIVTRAELDDEIVHSFVAAVFDNLDEFRATYPVFETLDPPSMLEGLTAPLHSGAERYFVDNGLM